MSLNNRDYRYQMYQSLSPYPEYRMRYDFHDESVQRLIYGAQFVDFRSRLDPMTERQSVELETPSPNSKSAIDDLETIKISPTHTESENSHSICPICLDRFEIGAEARKTPCNHIYHSECIVSWLVRRKTCPVCRHQLGSGPVNCRQNTRNTSSVDSNTSRRNRSSFVFVSFNNFGNPPLVGEIYENEVSETMLRH
ncbi:unnamed protein product [Amaranthus hypochondriacus]